MSAAPSPPWYRKVGIYRVLTDESKDAVREVLAERQPPALDSDSGSVVVKQGMLGWVWEVLPANMPNLTHATLVAISGPDEWALFRGDKDVEAGIAKLDKQAAEEEHQRQLEEYRRKRGAPNQTAQAVAYVLAGGAVAYFGYMVVQAFRRK